VTWPVDASQLPRPEVNGLGFNPKHKPDDTIDYDIEGANVGYKWFAAKGLTPQFAFGHGLSYTTFTYENLSATSMGQRLVATVDIRNTGKVAGADVAQLYLKMPEGSATPIRLIGFQKVTLQPGESRRIRIEAEPKTLASFDTADKQWKIAEGRYELQLSRSANEPVETSPVVLSGGVVR